MCQKEEDYKNVPRVADPEKFLNEHGIDNATSFKVTLDPDNISDTGVVSTVVVTTVNKDADDVDVTVTLNTTPISSNAVDTETQKTLAELLCQKAKAIDFVSDSSPSPICEFFPEHVQDVNCPIGQPHELPTGLDIDETDPNVDPNSLKIGDSLCTIISLDFSSKSIVNDPAHTGSYKCFLDDDHYMVVIIDLSTTVDGKYTTESTTQRTGTIRYVVVPTT